MFSSPEQPNESRGKRFKGISYWVMATVLVVTLFLGLPAVAILLISSGIQTSAAIGLVISTPGALLISIAVFRPDLLARTFGMGDDELGIDRPSRAPGLLLGVAIVASGVVFFAIQKPLFASIPLLVVIGILRTLSPPDR